MCSLKTNCFLSVMLFCPEQYWITSKSFFLFLLISCCSAVFWPLLNGFLSCFRWESYRTGCGPQTGAKRVRRGVHLPAEACGSLSYQCQDFLDCELNKLSAFQSHLAACGGHANLQILTSKTHPNIMWNKHDTQTQRSSFDKWRKYETLRYFFCLFLDCPSVTVRSGLPYILPDYWQLLVGPGCRGHIRSQHHLSGSAWQHRVRDQDTSILQWVTGTWQPHGSAANTWGR